jgi:hypothetical protein
VRCWDYDGDRPKKLGSEAPQHVAPGKRPRTRGLGGR